MNARPNKDFFASAVAADRSPARVVLTNGLILADPSVCNVEPHYATVIEGDALTAVNAQEIQPGPGDHVLDCSGCLIAPGLVNAHTHAAMSLLRGVADDVALDRWLHEYIFPAEARFAGEYFVYLGTKLSAVEMALSGTTAFADGYFHMEHAARAAEEVGLRIVAAQGILDVPAPDAAQPGAWRRRVDAFLADCPRSPLVKPALFCHSPYLCSPETLKEAYTLAAENGVRLFCHVAETAWEATEILKRFSATPATHLHSLGLLGERFTAVHAVHLSEDEIDLLARSQASVVHCPECNMKLASGAAPVAELLRRGALVGLGSDGAASNNNLDLFEEMRTASLLAKLVNSDPTALDARAALKMATLDGARAIGLGSECGSLAEGKSADLIVVDFNQPHLTPVYDPASHLVFSAKGSDVRDVFVRGRQVVANRRVTTVDVDALLAEVRLLSAEIDRELRAKRART
jgi:5-methylthioadenosine/S-adenosylhomocysteine deaminase